MNVTNSIFVSLSIGTMGALPPFNIPLRSQSQQGPPGTNTVPQGPCTNRVQSVSSGGCQRTGFRPLEVHPAVLGVGRHDSAHRAIRPGRAGNLRVQLLLCEFGEELQRVDARLQSNLNELL